MLATGVFFGCFLQAVATDYYVATNGSPSGTGTFGDPFGSVQLASDTVGPGDTVYIHGGKYHEAVTIRGLVGDSANRIVFQNYNDEEVIVAGTIPVTNNWSQWSQNFNVWNSSGYTPSTPIAIGAEFEAIINSILTDAKNEQFIRLNITLDE